jgi:hypothetical protein
MPEIYRVTTVETDEIFIDSSEAMQRRLATGGTLYYAFALNDYGAIVWHPIEC